MTLCCDYLYMYVIVKKNAIFKIKIPKTMTDFDRVFG